jgi:hypothetical protein
MDDAEKFQFYVYCTQWFLHITEILVVVGIDIENLGKGTRTIPVMAAVLAACFTAVHSTSRGR